MLNGKIRIYACGGCGTNIASTFEGMESSEQHADVAIAYLDTSKSNLPEGIEDSSVFILPDADGSGGVRGENHGEIAPQIKPLLLKHAPESFNVVIFSGAGGSGSVFGPLIVRELLERGDPVVAVMVGSSEAAVRCKNTLNTLKTLENYSRMLSKPVCVAYEHNAEDVRRSDVNIAARKIVSAMIALNAPGNIELDTMDIANWLDYTHSVGVDPRLTLLYGAYSDDEVMDYDNPISIASLLNDPDRPVLRTTANYTTAGFRKNSDEEPEVHLVLTTDGLDRIQKYIADEMTRYEQLANSRPAAKTSFVSDDDAFEETGMVL